MIVRRLRSERLAGRVVVSALVCLGFWHFAQGAYIPAKAWLAQELLQRAWRREADGHENTPPWPWADTSPVARLSARAGEVELIVLAGDSGRTLAFGPGHLSISAEPGEPGNSIIAGHRDTHFAFLRYLRPEDSIRVEMPDGREHLFTVTNLDVVDARRGSLLLDSDEPMLTLVTCYPFDTLTPGGPLRYVVTAAMVY